MEVTAEIRCNYEQTRACLKTEDNLFVCSKMEAVYANGDLQGITLKPVMRTYSGSAAREWLETGIIKMK